MKTMSCVVLVLIVLLSSELWAQQPVCDVESRGKTWCAVYFPQFVVGGGTDYANDIRVVNGWETGIVMKTNLDYDIPTAVRAGTNPQVVFNWYDSIGIQDILNVLIPGQTQLNEFAGGFNYSLLPHAAKQFIVSRPSARVQTGWLRAWILPTATGQLSMDVFVQYRYKVNGQQIGQATVTGMQPTRKFSFYARRYSGADQDLSETGVSLVNPNLTSATVTITRRDADGRVIDSYKETIQPYHQLSKFIGQMGPPLGAANFEGSIDVSSDIPIVGVALQTTGDGTNFNFSTIPASVLP